MSVIFTQFNNIAAHSYINHMKYNVIILWHGKCSYSNSDLLKTIMKVIKMKRKILAGLCIFFMTSTASAVVIDLDAAFDTENDGVIHFGDQYLTDFVDAGVDFNNATDISKTFNINLAPVSGGTFNISMDHYQVSFDANYLNWFSINGTIFDTLVDSSLSGDHDLDNDGTPDWVTQTFSGANSVLTSGSNTIVFHVGSIGANQDDFEITNFTLSYESDYQAIPEPATLALMGLGLAGIGFRQKKVV